MTITLELPVKLETELQSEAAQLGLSLEDYLLRVLSVGRPGNEQPHSGVELVAYWQREGLIGTRSDVTDSLEHARELRKQAERRERA